MPVITLEVLSNSSNGEYLESNNAIDDLPTLDISSQDTNTGIHFLTEKIEDTSAKDNEIKEDKDSSKAKTDLLEYMMRNDGSVVCKLCGEILQSRTHWYRHKYKLHVIQSLNPTPLFQCEQCLVYFKSRKGYIGHLASRHSDILSDSSPVLTNAQAEAMATEHITQQPIHEVKEEPDPELSIPTTSVPNYQNVSSKPIHKGVETRRSCRGGIRETHRQEQTNKADWNDRRSKEEKLVADIIDRVRRECEAQGSGSAARRGYTRRTTVMNT